MSVTLTYTMIVAAFLAVCAMCMEIAVRKRRSERPRHEPRDDRRIDPASPTPPGRVTRTGSPRRESILSR